MFWGGIVVSSPLPLTLPLLFMVYTSYIAWNKQVSTIHFERSSRDPDKALLQTFSLKTICENPQSSRLHSNPGSAVYEKNT